MKILIGYEGKAAGEAALTDLGRAGFPAQGEATVLTVADVWAPSDEVPPASVVQAFPYLAQVQVRAKKLLGESKAIAARGAERVRSVLPGWRVNAEASADSPAWAIFKKARDTGAQLVVVGSREKTGFARWVLGSVSHKVLMECPVSVRIARPRAKTTGPLRILIGVDGSPDAERAVDQVLERNWPRDTMVRVVAVADDRSKIAPSQVPSLARWARSTDTDPSAWLGRLVESVERRFVEKGLTVTGRVREGDPKKVLIDQASRWKADTVFLGARGLTRWERVVLGSVSTAVAMRAPGSVEVVRGRKK